MNVHGNGQSPDTEQIVDAVVRAAHISRYEPRRLVSLNEILARLALRPDERGTHANKESSSSAIEVVKETNGERRSVGQRLEIQCVQRRKKISHESVHDKVDCPHKEAHPEDGFIAHCQMHR